MLVKASKKFSLTAILGMELHDFKKFIPLAIIKTLVIFVYSILRANKDSLIITDLNAEVISTIKLWGVAPTVILFVIAYSKLSNHITQEKLFHIINGFFISFFALFAFVLYPNNEFLTLDFSDLIKAHPHIQYPLMMISHWSSSLFYIMTELWGSVMISLMFWQLVNNITSLTEARKTYGLLGMLGQLGLVFAGYIGGQIFVYSGDNWTYAIQCIMSMVVVSGIIISICQWFVVNKVIVDKRFDKTGNIAKNRKQKMKLSVIDSVKYILQSKYIGLIAVLVLCYGISINLVEGVWKSQLKHQFPNKSDLSHFTHQIQFYGGIVTVCFYMLGTFMLRRFSWRTCAMMTPIAMVVTGAIFFSFIVFKTQVEPLSVFLGCGALWITVIVGAMQNVLSKATKYSLFDSTKEMSYIPLDNELKTKGKAAVDVTGGRLGKSGGAIIQWLLVTIFPTMSLVSLSTPLFIIFIFIMVFWIYAVLSLSQKFNVMATKVQHEELQTSASSSADVVVAKA